MIIRKSLRLFRSYVYTSTLTYISRKKHRRSRFKPSQYSNDKLYEPKVYLYKILLLSVKRSLYIRSLTKNIYSATVLRGILCQVYGKSTNNSMLNRLVFVAIWQGRQRICHTLQSFSLANKLQLRLDVVSSLEKIIILSASSKVK